jgi:hypothetical protein
MAVPTVGYMLATVAVFAAPSVFQALLAVSITRVSQEKLDAALELARAALVSPWPFVAELAIALAMGFLIIRPRSIGTVTGAVVLAVAPLMLFMPPANPLRGEAAFSSAEQPLVHTLQDLDPHRVLTLDRPRPPYPGAPNQLAAQGIPDIVMFSALNLEHVDAAVRHLQRNDPGGWARRALGIDVLVTYGEVCRGRLIDYVDVDDAYVCELPTTATTPYWLPASAAQPIVPDEIGPPSAALDASQAVAEAVPLTASAQTVGKRVWTVVAPEAGWVLLDLAWYPGWEITVDGTPVAPLEALGGQLVPVPAGRHELVATLTLRDVGLGALLGLGGLALAAGWVTWPRCRHRLPWPRPSNSG